MAAQAAGIKAGDMPDLTIKEAKVYVLDGSSWRNSGAGLSGGNEIASLVTNSGIEGNFTLGNGAGGVRTPAGSWVDFAKANCVGKNLFDLLPTVSHIPVQNQPGGGGGAGAAAAGGGRGGGRGGAGAAGGGRGGAAAAGAGAAATAAPAPGRGGGGRGGDFVGGFNPGFGSRPYAIGTQGPNAHASVSDFILWDIMGKAVNRPIYKILGGTRNKIMAYASSQHLATVEDYIPDVQKAKAAGIKAYKIHPGGGQHKNGSPIPSYLGHIDEIKVVRETAGDDYTLLFDAVQGHNYYEALAIGRALDKYGYVAYEDPCGVPTSRD